MAVYHVHKTSDYTVMSNAHLRDVNLSLKAKGLLSVMLSLPDDWDYSVSGLVQICKEGQTTIESTLAELKETHYLVVTRRSPSETASGRFEYEYDIYETPQIQGVEKQGVENLPIEILPIENHPLNKNTNYKDTNNKNTNNKNIDHKEESKKEDGRDFSGGDVRLTDHNYSIINNNTNNTSIKNNISLLKENIKEIVAFLNAAAGKAFRDDTPQTVKLISGRLKNGYTVDDFKTVIRKKCAEWMHTDMEQYLRPATLFTPTHFESYLNAPEKASAQARRGRDGKMYGDGGIAIIPPEERDPNDDLPF